MAAPLFHVKPKGMLSPVSAIGCHHHALAQMVRGCRQAI